MNSNFSVLANQVEQQQLSASFGIPGGGASLDLIDALERRGIRFFTTNHEASAAIMAGTYGALKGAAGLAISIKGPGLANMVPGLAVCFFERLPMVALVEAPSRSKTHISQHKWIDHEQLASPLIKTYFKVGFNEDSLEPLFISALDGQPGPVLGDLLLEHNESICQARTTTQHLPTLLPREELITEIKRADRPILLIGSAVKQAKWKENLKSLRCPMFTTVSAKGLIDEANHPYSAGIYSGAGDIFTPEHSLIQKSDLVICLGVCSNELLRMDRFPPSVISIKLSETPFSERVESIRTFSDDAVEECISLLQAIDWGLSELKLAKKTIFERMKSPRFLPISTFEIIAERFHSSRRLVLDTGNFCTIAEHFWQARSPDEVLLAGNSRFMGTSIPMAIGASIVDPKTPVVIGVGDGGISMYLSELRLVADEQLPILILLLSDGEFGSISERAIAAGLTTAPLKRTTNNWVSIVESIGIKSYRATNEAQLVSAVDQWDPASGPMFVECVFAAEPYRQMVAGIR